LGIENGRRKKVAIVEKTIKKKYQRYQEKEQGRVEERRG